MQTTKNVFLVKYASDFKLRPWIIDHNGHQRISPLLERYIETQPERLENAIYRYRIRLLFKRVREAIGNYMCYFIEFAKNKFHLWINKDKAKILGIASVYSGTSFFEIYLSLCEALCPFLTNYDNEIIYKAS